MGVEFARVEDKVLTEYAGLTSPALRRIRAFVVFRAALVSTAYSIGGPAAIRSARSRPATGGQAYRGFAHF